MYYKKPYKHKRVNGVMCDVHVLVWIKAHGRQVPEGCVIHHIDGDKWNNDPSNLMLLSARDHRSIHAKKQKRNVYGCFA